jgi:hypothetical protein
MSTTEDSSHESISQGLTPNCTKTVAEVERNPETGEVLGIPVFITVDQIQAFGLVPEGIEAVVLKADRGRILIFPV